MSPRQTLKEMMRRTDQILPKWLQKSEPTKNGKSEEKRVDFQLFYYQINKGRRFDLKLALFPVVY